MPKVWGPIEPEDKKRPFQFFSSHIVLEIKHFHCNNMGLGINVLYTICKPMFCRDTKYQICFKSLNQCFNRGKVPMKYLGSFYVFCVVLAW